VRAITVLALLLAAAAGGVDAVGWLSFGGLYVAHMSGNTVGVTTHVALGDWAEVGRRAFVIAAFVAGLACGAAGSTLARRRMPQAGFVIALAIEAALLLVVLLGGEAASHGARAVPREPSGPYHALVAAAAAAMGVQSATLRRVGNARVRTTYVTGVLTRLVEQLVRLGVLSWVALRGQAQADAGQKRTEAREEVLLLGAVWLSYLAGGIAAGLLAVAAGTRAVILPLAGIAVAIALDWRLARRGARGARPPEEL
jgi:uncharacterized membrane protein YoaK (UPF0700 family)